MAVYWFHLRNSVDLLLDPDGRELDSGDISAAALREARAIISADVLAGQIELDQAIEVEDSEGRIVHRLSFAHAVKIIGSRAEGDPAA